MTTTINASTSSGLVVTPDNSGNVLLQYNGQSAPAFYAWAGANTSLTNNTWTKVLFNTSLYDTNSNYSTSTSRFTPTVAGYYLLTVCTETNSFTGNGQAMFYKNGSYYARAGISDQTSGTAMPAGAVVTAVTISAGSTGSIDLGFTPLTGGTGPGQTTTLGTKVPQGFLANATTTSRVTVATGGTGGGASLGNVANATNLVVVTAQGNASASGTVNGFIEYVIYDTGAQNV